MSRDSDFRWNGRTDDDLRRTLTWRRPGTRGMNRTFVALPTARPLPGFDQAGRPFTCGPIGAVPTPDSGSAGHSCTSVRVRPWPRGLRGVSHVAIIRHPQVGEVVKVQGLYGTFQYLGRTLSGRKALVPRRAWVASYGLMFVEADVDLLQVGLRPGHGSDAADGY